MRVVFRTEGNHQQGMGDVWGSIALADEFTRCGDQVLFLLSRVEEGSKAVDSRGYGFQPANCLDGEGKVLSSFRPDVVVVNKLDNPPEYIRFLREQAPLVVTVDDSGEGASYSHLQINVLYPVEGAVTGPRHVALRTEFQVAHSRPRTIPESVQELLVTQGGSDTYGFIPKIVRSLGSAECRAHTTVVLGPAFRHQRELDQAVASSGLYLTLIHDADNMSELMERADLAITAGGISMFELACVGAPSIVVCAERFEAPTAQRLDDAGAALNLGFGGDLDWHKLRQAVDALASNPGARQHMSDKGKEMVDGMGAQRTVALIKEQMHRTASSPS